MSIDVKREEAERLAKVALARTPEQLVADMHGEITAWDDGISPRRMQATISALQTVLAEQAATTADKNLKLAELSLKTTTAILAAHHLVVALTRQLRTLTWALLIFTAVLLILTGYLCQDVYAHAHHDEAQHSDNAEPAQAKP